MWIELVKAADKKLDRKATQFDPALVAAELQKWLSVGGAACVVFFHLI